MINLDVTKLDPPPNFPPEFTTDLPEVILVPIEVESNSTDFSYTSPDISDKEGNIPIMTFSVTSELLGS